MTKPLLKKISVAKDYQSKPEPDVPVNIKIVRNCLRCDRTFIAPTRFIRLCGCTVAR